MKIKVTRVLQNQEFTKQDGGTYKAMVVNYEIDGEPKQQKILGFAMTREPSLKSLRDAVGQEIDVEFGKNRFGGTEIVSVNSDLETPQTTNRTRPTSNNTHQKPQFNETGMRIMNSLNNAVALVGQGASIADVERVARQILALHDTLREPVKTVEVKPTAKRETTQKKAVAVEDSSTEDDDTSDDYDY